MVLVAQQWINADQFWEWSQLPENELMHLELVHGEVITMAPTGEEHGQIAGNSFGFLWSFVHKNKLGRVTAAETGYILHRTPDGRDIVRAPDVAFVRAERMTPQPVSRYSEVVPDLVVEVMSPNDTATEVEAKVREYLQYGVQVVWVVYPKTRTITVNTATTMQRLSDTDTLTGGDVLPQFAVRVAEFFD